MSAIQYLSPEALGAYWYELFTKFAEDLYPQRYTYQKCLELAELAIEIKKLAKEKESEIVVHNYLFPEFHELARQFSSRNIGDSLGLAFYIRDKKAKRVDFESVYFMGETAKLITGDETRVFVSDHPNVLGCSLVFGSDYEWIENWKKETGGVLVTYINSTAYLKSLSDFICTSRNADTIIVRAVHMFPNRKILVLPDKYLGYVMKWRALDRLRVEGTKIDPNLIEVYEQKKGEWHACCYVHEMIGDVALHEQLEILRHGKDIELMIHPECGCASSCLLKLQQGIIPKEKAYFLSTEGMVEHAKNSSAERFLVATEIGMIYRLRRECPDKIFIPISYNAECRYMKGNTLEKLLRSLKEDRLEIIICDDCCEPRQPYEDEKVVHIQKSVALKAKIAVERMFTTD